MCFPESLAVFRHKELKTTKHGATLYECMSGQSTFQIQMVFSHKLNLFDMVNFTTNVAVKVLLCLSFHCGSKLEPVFQEASIHTLHLTPCVSGGFKTHPSPHTPCFRRLQYTHFSSHHPSNTSDGQVTVSRVFKTLLLIQKKKII